MNLTEFGYTTAATRARVARAGIRDIATTGVPSGNATSF